MHRIDLGPKGAEGVEAKYWITGGTLYLWVVGSDHRADWMHHISPGAWKRELDSAYAIAGKIRTQPVKSYVIGGHSLGGTIAEAVAVFLERFGKEIHCYTFGGKRPLDKYAFHAATRYANRGDIVPLLPPWRPAQEIKRIGDLSWPWEAHHPDAYEEAMERVGF